MSFSSFAGMEYAQNAMHLVANELPWGAIYGLSNAALDTPWPKTVRLKSALRDHLASADSQQLIAQSLGALKHRSPPADDQLPSTGVPIALERALSTAFVSHPLAQPNYGTRTSLVAVGEAGKGLSVTELTYAHHGSPALTTSKRMDWFV